MCLTWEWIWQSQPPGGEEGQMWDAPVRGVLPHIVGGEWMGWERDISPLLGTQDTTWEGGSVCGAVLPLSTALGGVFLGEDSVI